MVSYKVLVNDNSHYMNQSERSEHGIFPSAAEAVAACRKIVDNDLDSMWRLGTTAAALYRLYVSFGPDPFAVPVDPDDPSVDFSAWTYAKVRCKEIASTRSS